MTIKHALNSATFLFFSQQVLMNNFYMNLYVFYNIQFFDSFVAILVFFGDNQYIKVVWRVLSWNLLEKIKIII